MTHGNENSPDDADPDSKISSRRRQLLAALATGTTAGIAGCGSTSSPTATSAEPESTATDTQTENGTSTEGTETEQGLPQTDRTYKTFHAQNLNEINWSIYGHREQWPRFVSKFAFAYKASYDQKANELIPMLVTDWSWDESTIEFKMRESGWSDGDPVTAKDWGVPYQLNRWQGTNPEEFGEDNMPEDWFDATTSIEWEDRTLRFISEPGWYDEFFMENVIRDHLTHPAAINLGNNIVIKADPYFTPIWEEASGMSNWADRKAAIDQWDQNEVGAHLDGWSQNQAGDYVPDDPTSIATTGPFTPSEITETQIVLKKNEHFWNADKINWPEVSLDTMLEVRQRNQALVNGRLSGMNGQVYTPKANILDQLSDDWGIYRHNLGSTIGLSLNRSTVDYFQDPRVRQAFYLAIDKQAIAEQSHKYANSPLPNPPGLNGPYAQYVPEDARSGFDNYKQDLDRASKLMQAAGFSKQGGSWTTPDGKPLELELLASSESTDVPTVIQSFLEEFGVGVKLVTNEGTVVDNRKSQGEFQMAMHTWNVGWILFTRAVQQSDRRHRFGSMLTDQEIQNWVDKYSDQGVENVEYDWTNNLEGFTNEMTKDFTLPLPPVGDRPVNKPPSEYRDVPVYYYAFTWNLALDEQTRQKRATELAWAHNWQLPYLPLAVSAQLAVQNQANWNAPTEQGPWMQHAPVNKLVEQGQLHAASE